MEARPQDPHPSRRSDTARRLQESLRRAARGGEREGLSAWIAALDAALLAIERAAWELRELAEEALTAARAVLGGWKSLQGEAARLSGEAKAWKGKLARLSSTGWMLTKVVADYRLFAIYSAFLSAKKRGEQFEKLHRRNARRFYETSVTQKGAFLKIGQMLSARPDILPGSWVQELSGLQDDVPPEDFSHVRQVIEEDLGGKLEDLFKSFDKKPLAAASIGQVHRAKTHEGVEVAVKVRRPGIGELIELDMALLELFLEAIQSMLPPTDLATIVKEVQAMVRGELDYAGEKNFMAKTARFFENTPGVIVPQPLDALCGPRVLTSTFIEGKKITDVLDRFSKPVSARSKKKNGAPAADPKARMSDILGRLLEIYFRQVLEAGFFQADPHPGNFLVTEQGEIVLLDFGCTKELPEHFRTGYIRLVQAFFTQDKKRLAVLLADLGFATQSGSPDTLLLFADAMLREIRAAAVRGNGADFRWPTKKEMLSQAADILEQMNKDPVIRIPAEFVMLARVFGTLGGLFLHYQPSVDLSQRILPLVMKAMTAA